ncbi:MAG: hypothetical protein ACLUEQ_04835 [Cloacibacillus evryensis]
MRGCDADEDVRSLKSLILFGLRGMAAYAYHAMVLGYSDREVNDFFYEALAAIGREIRWSALLPLVLKRGGQPPRMELRQGEHWHLGRRN